MNQKGAEMKTFCEFLGKDRSGALRCKVGLNFASVGSERALCRTCPLADLGDTPLCPNADVYTSLQRDSTGAFIVRTTTDCSLPVNAPAEARCTACPERLAAEGTDSRIARRVPTAMRQWAPVSEANAWLTTARRVFSSWSVWPGHSSR